jgi:hypothetical protein
MKSYTLEEMNEAWEDYSTQKVISYYENGKKMIVFFTGRSIDMTGFERAKIVDLKSVMSFPDFLEKRWQKEK